MKRITRTTLAAVATLAVTFAGFAPGAAADTAQFDLRGYEYRGVVQLGDGTDAESIPALDSAVGSLLDIAKPVSCIPKTSTISIHPPKAYVYYGLLESIYVWEGLGEAEITGCPENTVTVRVKMRDQALNGSSLPAEGADATASGKARAGAVAELLQRYNNTVMALNLSYHTLTVTVMATQTDGRTTTAFCATKSFTYLATVAGPQMVGETPVEKAKCGS